MNVALVVLRLKRTALKFGPILLLLTIGTELGLRFGIGLGDPPLYLPHPRIEYLMKPGCYQPFGRKVFINSAGMRSSEAAISDLLPFQNRLLVLGDSIVNGGALIDDRDLATTLLESEMSGGQPLSVCNISAGSWGPGNWLAYLQERGTFGAEFAIIVLNDADAFDAPTFAPLDRDHPAERPSSAVLELLVRYLPRYLPLNRSPATSRPSEFGPLSDPLQSLESGIDLLRNRGLTVGAILWPSEAAARGVPGPGTLVLLRMLQTKGVPIVEPSACLAAHLASGAKLYADGLHPNVAGQRLLSRLILNLLRALEAARAAGTKYPTPHS